MEKNNYIKIIFHYYNFSRKRKVLVPEFSLSLKLFFLHLLTAILYIIYLLLFYHKRQNNNNF